jgi:membrane associated rhomboid family serine protease
MFPLKDDNPTRTFPFFTVLLIGANTAVFLYQLSLPEGLGEQLVMRLGAIPAHVVSQPFGGGGEPAAALTLLTSMFLHGSILHLVGNMLYLWIFGNNIEDSMGHVRFLVFYVLSGMGAHAGHIATSMGSTVPTIGASGAIAGILGAYLLLYPHARVLVIIPIGFFSRLIWVPAIVVLGLWFVLQFLNGLPSLAGENIGGVAWFAHIGVFTFGLVFARLFVRNPRRSPWGGGG